MQLEDKLYDLAMAYWGLEEKNYDVEYNYQELLDFEFTDPELDKKLDDVIARCEQIRDTEKPPSDPEVMIFP